MLSANPTQSHFRALPVPHGDNLYCVVVIVTEHWFYFQ